MGNGENMQMQQTLKSEFCSYIYIYLSMVFRLMYINTRKELD